MMDDTQLATVAPTTEAVTAAAAQSRAVVEARYVLALRRPRNMDDTRVRILRDCERSKFADTALYEKPVGGRKIVGLSIRFVEAALAHMGNILVTTNVVLDSPDERIVNVEVSDLERNVTHSKPVVIKKTVERKQLRPGQEALGSRINAQGERIWIVEASDDDLLNKEGALVSKALRVCGLRLIPGDILDEAEEKVNVTLRKRAEADPDGERKAIADAFANLGVFPTALAKYLGHELSETQPAELVELRALYQAIRDGEATWQAALALKLPQGPEGGEAALDPATARLREKLAAAKAKPRATTKKTMGPGPKQAPVTEPPLPLPPEIAAFDEDGRDTEGEEL